MSPSTFPVLFKIHSSHMWMNDMKKDKRVFLLLAVSYRKKYLIGLRVARVYVLSIMGKADSISTCSGYWGY